MKPETAGMTAVRTLVAHTVILLALSAQAAVALADVFKCAGERGTPIYQESPCPPGKELRNFQVDPPEITVLPAPALARPAPARAGNTGNPASGAKEPKSAKPGTVAGNAAERKHIRSGMSEAEVIARLGRPDVTAAPEPQGARWTYLPTPGDPETITSSPSPTAWSPRRAQAPQEVIRQPWSAAECARQWRVAACAH
jgi:hypothetical protein